MTDTRGVAFACEVCGVDLHEADVHHPHDEGCPQTNDCICEHFTCPRHCWTCNTRMTDA